MAQAKHFVAYEGADDTIVDGQALREVYLAPFKAVVDAGVASRDVFLQPDQWQSIRAATRKRSKHILRGEYGFRGFVTSDWGATHGAEFITRGLDMEQPGTGPGAFFALAKEPEEQGMSTEEVDDLDRNHVLRGSRGAALSSSRSAASDAAATAEDVSSKLGEALARGSVVEADIDRAVGARARADGAFRLARPPAATHGGAAGHRGERAHHPAALPSAARCCSRTTACCRFATPISIRWRSSGPAHCRPSRSSPARSSPTAARERQVGAWHALKTMTKSEGSSSRSPTT